MEEREWESKVESIMRCMLDSIPEDDISKIDEAMDQVFRRSYLMLRDHLGRTDDFVLQMIEAQTKLISLLSINRYRAGLMEYFQSQLKSLSFYHALIKLFGVISGFIKIEPSSFVDSSEALFMHLLRSQLKLSISEIATILGRSKETVHRNLKHLPEMIGEQRWRELSQ